VRKPYETTKRFLIQEHYRGIAEDLTWDVNRYRRLCAALQLTEAELAAFIRFPLAQLRQALRKNSFPETVELHLTLIERSVFPSSKSPVFPPLP
jgi:hypothetical protein